MRKNLICILLKKNLNLLLFTIISVHYMFNILKISRKNNRKKGMVFKQSFRCLKKLKNYLH